MNQNNTAQRAEEIVRGRIEAIKARCEAATPGPWYADGWATWDDLEGTFVELSEFTADAKFIAHAREDIPYLLGLIETQDAEIASREQASIDEHNEMHYSRDRAQAAEAQLSASQQETRAAVEDMKRIADKARVTYGDETCCFACKYDGDFSTTDSGAYANECPGFDKDDCFEWRGPQEAGEAQECGPQEAGEEVK